MNDFAKSLQTSNTKENDKKIIKVISELLEKVEDGAQVKEYMEQVADRRSGITKLFENFDYNMEIIEGARSKIIKKPRGYEMALDKYISKKIKEHKEDIYQEVSKDIPQDEYNVLNNAKNQVDNRIKRIGNLLENYRYNQKILEEHKQRGKKYKIETVTHIEHTS